MKHIPNVVAVLLLLLMAFLAGAQRFASPLPSMKWLT